MFVKYWDEEKQKTVRKALDTFRKTYFKAWENYVYPEKPHYWAAFAARLSQTPGQIEMFFTDFPDGKFISIIREPVSWYASAKKHNPESYKSLDEAIFLWQSSVLAARNYKRIYGKKVLLLFFEELVKNTKNTTKIVCNFLDISWDSALMEPTFNHSPIRADTSFFVERSGILHNAINREEYVHDEDKRVIRKKCLKIFEATKDSNFNSF